MGAKGFIGGAVATHLRGLGAQVLGLSRADVDLLQPDADEQLAKHLTSSDSFVFVSALAPCRDNDLLLRNLTMVRAVCAALEKAPVAHVINISSDAVYAPSFEVVSEATPAAPADLHGTMHVAREQMLRAAVKSPLAILRPSLLYGAADPHNGYGPNRFRRFAAEGKDIPLFGQGEEKRDHVLIDDAAKIVGLCLTHRSRGLLNVATGVSVSFREAAELAVKLGGGRSRILGSERKNAILHRHFDAVARIKAFPRFAYTAFADGMSRVQRETGASNG